MKKRHLAFIGGGNMSRALIAGLKEDPDLQISVADPGADAREILGTMNGISIHEDNRDAIAQADCVIFAVKPQIMKSACAHIKEQVLEQQPLIVSVAAGIESGQIAKWFGNYDRIIRVMPNTPALISAGATALYGRPSVSLPDRELANAIFNNVGLAIWVEDESLIDVVTALSGSGPAYFFYLLESLEKTATKMGLDNSAAQKLARQTALGAALMSLQHEGDLEILRDRVTSPGGTTEAALNSMADNNLPAIIESALVAAADRARELAAEFG